MYNFVGYATGRILRSALRLAARQRAQRRSEQEMIANVASKIIWAERARNLTFWFLALLVAASIGVLVGARSAHAAEFRVNSMDDAIEEANANDLSDTISFSSGMSGTITLTLGQLTITNDISGPDLAITGPGGSGLTVSGNNKSRVFLINSAADATID